ncbi:MAG: hypothetical protein ACO28M_08335 [Vulcanococcus sp.]
MSDRIPGRVYTSADLHGAALVCMDRRHAIERLVLQDFPRVEAAEAIAIVKAVNFYLTIGEELFNDVVEGR